ncbi:SDR family NAD(P)-dependent oxidoreductase [Paracoccaceae bacterium GXU_MW_L88]
MTKTIMITGATDGIGLATAKMLAAEGHHLLLHGRSKEKLDAALAEIGGDREGYLADMADLSAVEALAGEVLAKHNRIDVLINNAGVFKTPQPVAANGQDTRFVVNTLAPILLTRRLAPALKADSRVVNLSSAAQAPVDLAALRGETRLEDFDAYAQSKLALTMWSQEAAKADGGPVMIAVNPGSLLGSKMVKEGFGRVNGEVTVGAEILKTAALSPDFAEASGRYFDNDSGAFAAPHSAASQPETVAAVLAEIDGLLP